MSDFDLTRIKTYINIRQKSQKNKNDEIWEYSNAIILKLTIKENCEKDIKDFEDKFPEYFL